MIFVFGALIDHVSYFLESRYKGPVAQWITRLTTDQKIPGSTPGRLVYFVLLLPQLPFI